MKEVFRCFLFILLSPVLLLGYIAYCLFGSDEEVI